MGGGGLSATNVTESSCIKLRDLNHVSAASLSLFLSNTIQSNPTTQSIVKNGFDRYVDRSRSITIKHDLHNEMVCPCSSLFERTRSSYVTIVEKRSHLKDPLYLLLLRGPIALRYICYIFLRAKLKGIYIRHYRIGALMPQAVTLITLPPCGSIVYSIIKRQANSLYNNEVALPA